MSGGLRRRRIGLIIFAAAMLAVMRVEEIAAQPVSVATGLSSSNDSAIVYRRVFVPAERATEWPTAGAQYLPVERTEFERLVEQAEDRTQLIAAGGAQVVSAEYAAQMTDDGVVKGTAQLEVRLPTESPCVAPLDPWNAIITAATWEGDAEAPATLGLWTSADGRQSRHGVVAHRSGRLHLDWQTPADWRSDSTSKIEHILQFPSAVTQRLELELPAGCTPTISNGRLIEQTATVEGRRRWVFQLAIADEHRLQISRPSATATVEKRPLPLLAMTEAYSLASDGVDYEAELRLSGRAEPLTELRIASPASLHVATITINRLPAVWRRDEDDAETLIVTLPPTDGPMTVTIVGAATTVLDAPWVLPGVVPAGVFWTEGTSTLWVDPALEVRSIAPRECSLLNLVGIGSGNAGEVFRAQAWSRSATVELIVGDRQSQLQSRAGTLVEFADRELAANVRAVVWASEGRVFDVAMPLGADWTVESIEAAPADSLVEWHVEEGSSRKLHLQLRRSPTELQPLMINLAARKSRRGWSRTATIEDLDLLQLPGTSQGRWLTVKDRRGSEVIPEGKLADACISYDSLSAEQQELLGEVASEITLDLRRAARSSTVSLQSTPARFSGEGWMELSAVGEGFEHRAELLCRPIAGAVGELRIFAAQSLPADVRWEVDGNPALVTVETAPSAVTGPSVASRWAEYRLRLTQPRSASFRLRASWRGAGADGAAVNTLTLPDAETWQAWAILRGQPGHAKVDARNATPTSAVPATRSNRQPLLGCFRLSDDPSLMPSTAPVLSSVVPNAGEGTNVVAWHCDATTRQFADGHQSHRILYQLESRQSAEIELQPSPGVKLVSLVVSGRAIDVTPLNGAGQTKIRLPGDAAMQTLIVEMESKAEPLGSHCTIAPLLPRTSFRVVRGNWTLEWPSNYRARDEKPASSSSWLHRLAGPFAGESGKQWYDGMLLTRVSAAPQEADDPEPRTGSLAGWSSKSQSFVDAPTKVELVRSSSVQAQAHLAWLASAVIGGWLWRRWAKGVAFMAAVAAIVCLVVPEGWHQLPQAVFLGIVTGAATRQAFHWFHAIDRNTPAPVSLILLAFTLTMQGLAPARAQEGPESGATSPPQVLFPVDSQGAAVGADVYVPASLAAALLPGTTEQPRDQAALVGARYQLELAPDATTAGIVCNRAMLRFDWETSRPNVRVDVPLSRDDGEWEAASFLLNGQPFAPTWNADGTSLSVVLVQPGKHEISVALKPLPEADGQRGRVRLHVPQAPGATIEMAHPAGFEGIHALGASRPVAPLNAIRTVMRLAAVDVLDVSWPARTRAESTGATVEQLSVLEINPAVARLDVRLRFSGTGTLDVIRLAISPQLKLMPLAEGSQLDLLPSDPRRPNLVELRFRSPPTLPITAPLQFQLQRTLSVGRIVYPSVDILGMSVRRRHFAVNVDRRLRIREEATTGLTSTSAAELEEAWGLPLGMPTLQYSVAAEAPTWSVEVAPVAPRFTPRETLEVRCEAEEAQFIYEAAITDVDGEALVHRLVMPADLQIDRVTATVEGPDAGVPLRWARPRPDQVEVFLGRPLSEPHRLRVEGRKSYAPDTATAGAAADAGLTTPAERRLLLPLLGLESTMATPLNVAVYRASDVLVDATGSTTLSGAANAAYRPERGQYLGAFSLTRTGAAPELKVRSNEAQFTVDTLLGLELDAVEPIAECRLQGTATRGVLDSLRLSVGKNWRGPFTCDPAGQVVQREIPGDAANQVLEVQPARPIAAGEEFSLRISGPISLESDQRIRFPSLRVIGAQQQRGYLILPPAAGNQTAEWTLRGLDAESLPPKLAATLTLPGLPRAYRIGLSRFVAEQRVFPDAMRGAGCRLVENRVAIDAEGRAVAVSQLLVQAGGGGDLQVQLPLGAQLLYAAVDGTPLAEAKATEGIWQAPAGSRYLPRVILLSYRLPQFKETRKRRLSPPQVSVDGKVLTPSKALWQVTNPAQDVASMPASLALTQEEFEIAARRGQIAALLDSNTLASQLHEWEAAQWRQPWLDRLATGDAKLSAQDPPTWTRLRERLMTGGPSDAGRTVDVTTCWDAAADSTASYFQGDVDGSLTLVRDAAPREVGRWLAAIALAGVVGAAWRRPAALQSLGTWWRRWPHVWIIGVGLLWWLFLTPSLLGVAIIVVALAAYIKSRTQGVAHPTG